MKRTGQNAAKNVVKKIKTSPKTMETAQAFLDYVNASPSPFHAVDEAKKMLVANGFTELHEAESWNDKIQPNGKYFTTRNQSALVGFMVGGKYQPGEGFNMIGAHTDSPNLRVKPISKIESQGWLQVGVETYGGGLWHTWFDRDLGVAGRVIVKDEDGKGFTSRLVMINKPIMRIPTLAIHLDRGVNDKGFLFNKETQLRPVLATAVKAELEKKVEVEDEDENVNHQPLLLLAIAEELNVPVSSIYDFELSLFDTQGSNVGGILNEFIFSPRLDNQCCSWLGTEALIRSIPSLKDDTNVRLVALFDNEEVGSNSRMGAGGNLIETIMQRVAKDDLLYAQASRKSFMISADMAHAVHPNYTEKHEQNHRPKLHEGPVIKYNANERYATSAEGSFIMKELARRHDIPLQEFVIRQDQGCGSTIGPILSTRSGIRTLDVGLPQLSMHSIREMCGTEDLEQSLLWFNAFFNEFTSVDNSLKTE